MAKKQKVQEQKISDFPEIPVLSNDEIMFGKYPKDVFDKILEWEKENQITLLYVDTLLKLVQLGGDLKYKERINPAYKNKCVCLLQAIISSTENIYWIQIDNPKTKVCCGLIKQLCG